MLSPLALEIAAAVFRALLLWFGSRAVTAGVLTPDQSDRAVEALTKHALQYAPLVAIVAWSVVGKWRKQLQYIAGRRLPRTASEAEVKTLASQPGIKALAFVDPATIGKTDPIEPPRRGTYVGGS